MAETRGRDPDDLIEVLLTQVEVRLRQVAARWHGHGRALDQLGEPSAIAERMVAVLPSPSPWNEVIGPFHRTSTVARLLGVTRQAVDERRARGTLLGCRTNDGHWVFPSFQFAARGLRPEVGDLLARFGTRHIDGWTLAAWFTSPQRSLGGNSALAHLERVGMVDDTLTALAADQRARWAA